MNMVAKLKAEKLDVTVLIALPWAMDSRIWT